MANKYHKCKQCIYNKRVSTIFPCCDCKQNEQVPLTCPHCRYWLFGCSTRKKA